MNAEVVPLAKFRLGRIVTTPHAKEVITSEDILVGISRHQAGDWGELPESDRVANDRALINGTRLLSAYRSAKGPRFWIITEADRSLTTVLMPEEHGFNLSPAGEAFVSRQEKAAPPKRKEIARGKVIPLTSNRTLKIEEDGDFWRGAVKPKIRLKGHWLQRAGFRPGNHVSVKLLAPGVIELRSNESLSAIPSEAPRTGGAGP